jgi:hypothetical protein
MVDRFELAWCALMPGLSIDRDVPSVGSAPPLSAGHVQGRPS